MKALLRGFWAAAQVLYGAFVLLKFSCTRRGGVLVFSHFQDMDADGTDTNLGPLVNALAEGPYDLMELTLVPLTRSTVQNRRRKGRDYIPLAAIFGPARLLAGFGGDRRRLQARRALILRGVLAILSPRVVYLVDESGSGQPLVIAARARGTKTIAVQHGDVGPRSAQYARTADSQEVLPVDHFCVWSEYFRDRLFATSTLYGPENTVVTGRVRPIPEPARTGQGPRRRVLVLGAADPKEDQRLQHFYEGVRAAEAVDASFRPHPSRRGAAGVGRTLLLDLEESDIVVTTGSSALFDAIALSRTVIFLVEEGKGPPSDLIGLDLPCTSHATDFLARQGDFEADSRGARRREMVFGGARLDAVLMLLGLGHQSNPKNLEDLSSRKGSRS